MARQKFVETFPRGSKVVVSFDDDGRVRVVVNSPRREGVDNPMANGETIPHMQPQSVSNPAAND